MQCKDTSERSRMAEQPQSKDLFTRLAEAGEDAIHKIADMPGAAKLTDAVNTLRGRVDELQKRVRGLDELEQRVADLERRVDKLSAAKPAPRRRTSSTKRAAPKEGPATTSETG
jgi:polyhydroxyalkanoate synthesis regulator phasin